jgi:metalloendopeptidase OMA1, mitochondrial
MSTTRQLSSIVLALSLVLSSCATLGGGKEISDAEINAEAAKAYEEVKTKNKRSSNAVWTAMVNRVSDRIAKASGENYKWEVVLLENPEPNAWCMPGGKMAVYTGIMPILKTEGALAAVMGHEVAHATLKHGKQSYARSIRDHTTGLLIGAATIVGGQLLCKDSTCRTLTALGGAAAGFAVTFFSLKYSRSHESEADERGQLYMARAGYDPSESIKLWERMGSAGGKKPPEFMSTHPADDTRRDNLNKWMPNALSEYRKAPTKFGLGDTIR